MPPDPVELNERGRALADKGWLAEAETAYRQAIAADPTWSVPHYNLGLLLKYQHRWPESLAVYRRATDLATDDGDSWWNLGIAATAVGDWVTARQAWFRCGLQIPPGEGPPECDYGVVPIRLNPETDGEVVWGRRIDPARAVLESIPFAASGFRWRDMVLHDGAANGYRIRNGREVPVFDALERLAESPYATWEVQAEIDSVADFEVLQELAEAGGGAAENWATTVTMLCRACSEGRPHRVHDTDRSADTRRLPCAIAALDEAQVDRILAAWKGRLPHIKVLERWLVTP
ncbi:MAG TPA: tetratricopeptide repeat protein [Gemmatimonadales bacterium]|nr:tetratricopeptide repeat protein [Gemmatimonadales bacterium]